MTARNKAADDLRDYLIGVEDDEEMDALLTEALVAERRAERRATVGRIRLGLPEPVGTVHVAEVFAILDAEAER